MQFKTVEETVWERESLGYWPCDIRGCYKPGAGAIVGPNGRHWDKNRKCWVNDSRAWMCCEEHVIELTGKLEPGWSVVLHETGRY